MKTLTIAALLVTVILSGCSSSMQEHIEDNIRETQCITYGNRDACAEMLAIPRCTIATHNQSGYKWRGIARLINGTTLNSIKGTYYFNKYQQFLLVPRDMEGNGWILQINKWDVNNFMHGTSLSDNAAWTIQSCNKE